MSCLWAIQNPLVKKGWQGLNPRVIRFQSLHVLLHHLVGIGKIFWCGKVAGQSNLNSKFNLNMSFLGKTGTLKLFDVLLLAQFYCKIFHAEIKIIIFIALFSYLTTPANFIILLKSV